MACQCNQADCALVLIKEGKAGVQERNSKSEWVPLHEAAFRGHLDCCKVLLQYNAPLRPRTKDMETPRDLAMRYNKNVVVELLGNVSNEIVICCLFVIHRRC